MGASSGRPQADEEEQQSLLGNSQPKVTGLKNRAAVALGLKEPEPPPRWRSCLPELSYSTRLAGFAFCFILGTMLSLTSMSSFAGVLLGNPLPFAFKYTVGNLLSLCSYGFLVGPARQCSGMFGAERCMSTSVYLGSLASTLVCVFWLHNYVFTFVSICVQFFAMLYYALGVVPFGHVMLRRGLGC